VQSRASARIRAHRLCFRAIEWDVRAGANTRSLPVRSSRSFSFMLVLRSKILATSTAAARRPIRN